MFTRRGHGDVKKSTQKVLDPKKDVLTRLKHLRSLLEIFEKSELKTFFESNCSQIYFIFYENFITLESNLKQKGNKSQREELDSILFIFEKILQLLPEKIYSRWQFHSIGSILKKLLHTGNSFKIRCEGIRLFLLWLQALQNNCAEEQFLIFACLVPGFPAVPSTRGPCTLDTIIYNPFSNPSDAKVVPEEITPLVPAVPGEKLADDQTCYILQTLLKFMVVQASSLEWRNKDNQDTGFRFLFSLFKKYYLPHLFPSFTKLTNLYKPLLDLPHHRPKPLYVPVTRNNESTFCTRDQYLAPRVVFITWLVTFFLDKKYISTPSAKNGTNEVIPKLIQVGPLSEEPHGPTEPEKSHSNSSTLSDRRPSDSSLCSIDEEHRSVYDMVHGILLSTRDNINFVNEVFHQAFLLPSCETSATRKVIKVYRKWILQEKPGFMTEPEKSRQAENRDIKAGIQPTLQVFLTNSANVFLLEPCQDVPKLLDNQVEVCKGVLSIYRHMIMEHAMNTQTWYGSQHLIRAIDCVLCTPTSLMQSFETKLLLTIIVAWVRANLCVFISRELWDELLSVLSSLTGWEELVTEWASIMDSLTAVLARSVYGLDMSNLPLDKLSEQKEKKQRGRGKEDSQKAAAVARSFSLSWRNQGDQQGVQEPMRFRSATTSGAPGVEKARNNVRQKATASVWEKVICSTVQCPECALSPHSAPLSQHQHHQHPPASPALLVHPECRDCPQLLEDTMHQSVLHMPQDLDSSECLTDDVSIIAGGSLTGWHADSAFVLWRRILGILGDVNSIRCPRIHAKVFSYLYDLWHKLAKIRDNLGISVDNQSSPPRPVFIPPLRMLASWLFKATMLPSEFKMGKLQAYKLICEMMTKNQDVLPNSDFLVHLYQVMHKGFTSEDQDVLNTVIRSCSPRFFYLGLPGFTMLVGDFITAAARILSHDTAPRIDAQTVLGSLVCFPNLYLQIPLLQTVPGTDNIDYLVNILLKTARNEPCEAARCIAVCSLGLWVCEELMQNNIHHQVKDAINVLGVTLKFGNKAVAHVACDLFQLLISHWEHLQRLERSLPKKIIELMVSLLLCLLDWCMAMPLSMLLEPITMPVLEDSASHKAPLLDYIYRVGNRERIQCQSTLSYFHHRPIQMSYSTFKVCSMTPWKLIFQFLFPVSTKKRRNMELIPLTARMIMTHLVNHLGHHPLSGGPALLHSLVSENHDNPFVESSELSSEVFKSPNLQLFVFNDSTLVSYLQVPSEPSGPGEPYDNSSQVRVIVRDISGKYSWDGGVLYHPSNHSTTKPTSPGTSDPYNHSTTKHTSPGTSDPYNHSTTKPTSPGTSDPYNHSTTKPTSPGTSERSNPPGWDSQSGCDEEEVDGLDQLLEDLGYSSPECLPQPRLRLNQPAPSPCGMNLEQEGAIMEAILRQMQQEEEQMKRWNADVSVKATGQREPAHQEPKALFYFCRLLLNDLGMNSWDHRYRAKEKVGEKKETHKIAVFYIGEGQEDKCSILSNSAGSQTYEDFVSGLGWEVDLATHCGFMGGLQRNGSTGHTAPYYATSTVEVILHVSTRMPSNSDDCLTKKLRHLGNDEVHIVWSEHSRDYRRGIIPTDFGDVLIIVYPMKNHTFFIQIMKKPQVPFFGPLFNGAIVTGTLLPSLVRATCINASRAVKSRLTLYQSFYEERALYLEAIVQNHREVMTFEDFASQVFSPSTSYYPMSGTGQNPTLLLHFLLYFTAAHLLALLFRPLHLYVLVLVSSHPHSDEYQRQQGQALSTLSEQQHQRLYRGSIT
uniref:Ral GTPase activating protein catalytic subunit alpha 2 n=1 Tax=Oncorhynchus mykiss TaxID=8022 RepID=A0A8C7SQS6_ONCMY